MKLAIPGHAAVTRITSPLAAATVLNRGSYGCLAGEVINYKDGSKDASAVRYVRIVDVIDGLYAVIDGRGIYWYKVHGKVVSTVDDDKIQQLVNASQVFELLNILN